jgi:hypothetical protein
VPAPGAPDPVNCTGYAEPRVSLETQDWWTRPGLLVEGMSQHIHLATCFPVDQTLKGTVPFDIHVQLHMNPGVLTLVDLQVFGNGVSESQVAAKPNVTCPTAQCDLWYHIDYDTTKVPADGALEFRFHAKVTSPDGTIGYTSSGWQAVLANGGGRSVQSYRKPPWIEARGWYTGTDYENSRFTSPLPSGPLQGSWTFNVSLAPGSGGTPVNHVLVSVDPHFHFDPVDRGRVIFEKAGSYVGPITIDTTQLSNGVHRLFMRADSPIAAGTGSGIMAFNFTVNNPGISLVGSLALANDVVRTSMPVLPSLIVLVLLAMIMPRWSARRRATTVRAGHSGSAAVETPIVRAQAVADGGLDRSRVMPSIQVEALARPPLAQPLPDVARPMPAANPVAVTPVVVPPAAGAVVPPTKAVVAEPAPRLPMTKDAAWIEYRRATNAATSPQAVAAATLDWVRAVDRIKRAEATGDTPGG